MSEELLYLPVQTDLQLAFGPRPLEIKRVAVILLGHLLCEF